MNIDTGNIVSPVIAELIRTGKLPTVDLEQAREREFSRMREMALPPTPQQIQRGRVGRNDPCPCGSGKKFKRCCFAGSNPR